MYSCLYLNFIQEHLSFLFSTVSNSFFHILPSFILPHLRYPCLHTSFTSFEQIYSLLDANSQFSIGQETEYNKAINFCYFARFQ